jgi:co-chaperonin GroES (HSP10)
MLASARITLDYDSIDQAFPEADPGLVPFGSRILIQKRSPRKVTKGGIIVLDETQDAEFWNTQVAKVIALGPGAFKNRDSLEVWPEGEWCEVGAFVRVPKYGGDKWVVDLSNEVRQRTGAEQACFVLYNDLDLIGQITCNPMDVIAYL